MRTNKFNFIERGWTYSGLDSGVRLDISSDVGTEREFFFFNIDNSYHLKPERTTVSSVHITLHYTSNIYYSHKYYNNS